MISLVTAHYTNRGIRTNGALSVNVVEESCLEKADAAGCASGAKVDKSGWFDYTVGETGAPLLDAARVTMECVLEDTYETSGFDNFIITIKNTFADESVLDERGRVDYRVLKPVLFEMPTYEYLRTGDVIGRCMKMNKKA